MKTDQLLHHLAMSTWRLCAPLALCCAPAMAQAQLNDTGLISCYNTTAITGTVAPSTPAPEQTGFEGQDCTRGASAANALGFMTKVGASTIPGRDYSKIGNDGSVLAADATLGSAAGDWACTRDNNTGLVWEVKVNDAAHLRHLGHEYTWYDTDASSNGGNAGTQAGTGCNGTLAGCNTTAFRDAVNAQAGGLCGAIDWRVPSLGELQSLLDRQRRSGAAAALLDNAYFPNSAYGGAFTARYRARETCARTLANAWLVDFSSGQALDFFPKSAAYHVQLVRGGI
jgi:hypothetical protein